MKTNKRITAFLLVFTIILALVPTSIARASIVDIKIISKTEVTAKQAKEWAKSKGATNTFIELADLYWKYASEHGGVNPGIAYVQAAKETGYGKFGGVLDESYHNPCGLKTSAGGGDYDPNAHQRFNNWDEGVQAHLDHLALYAGAQGYPRSNTYDPRHFATIKGKAPTVNTLGGNWAPSSTYGEEVNKLYSNLLKSAGVESETDNSENDDNQNDNSQNDNENSGSNSDTDSPEQNESQTPVMPQIPSIPDGMEATKPVEKPGNNNTNISSSIGWKYEGGKWYYYRSDGSKATGWIKPGNDWYYLYNNGQMATGWIKLNGFWYYLKSSGAMHIGWLKDGAKWYYLQGDGSMVTGLKLINGKKYYLDAGGAMRTGWVQISGYWYYFSNDGDMLTGWIKPDGRWYYLYSNGIMATGWWKDNGSWYYLNPNSDGTRGAMKTGWCQISGSWYYFNTDGRMLTGWIKPDGNWYYLQSNGVMATGWLNVGSQRYHFKSSGVMSTGWLLDGKDYYYLNPSSGAMMKNTVVDGWQLGSDGKRIDKTNNDSNNNNNSTGTKKLIVIDPGHNFGGDDGAYATHNGVTYSERDLNMQLGIKLKAKLEAKGYQVMMTRNEFDREILGVTQSLTNRVNMANNFGADFFVSLHHNAASTASANGIETYYSTNAQDASFGGAYSSAKITKSRNMAVSINNSLVSRTGATDRGAKTSNLFVCRNTKMASVLIEFGFITNYQEALRCADSAKQEISTAAVADAIAAGI